MSDIQRSPLAARLAAFAVLGLILAGLISGCGSSKPAYCTQVNDFTKAVGELTSSGSASAIASNATKVVTTGQAAVSAVKTDFAPETAALKSSLTALASSAKELLNSGTRASALQKLPDEITAVKTAGTKFTDAAHPKCS